MKTYTVRICIVRGSEGIAYADMEVRDGETETTAAARYATERPAQNGRIEIWYMGDAGRLYPPPFTETLQVVRHAITTGEYVVDPDYSADLDAWIG